MYIMGFNYEVYYDANILQQKFKEPSVSMAMHSFSHRTESTLAMFWDGKYKDNVVPGETTFEFFGQTPTILNKGYAGNTHFTPNSNQDATYHIQDKKATNFLNWNPQHTNAKTVHGCEAWDCYEGDYFDMWFQNIPGRCTSAKMKKTDGTPMPNMWYAMFKNQYYYENTDCLHINQYFVRNGNLWNRNNKLGWSKWENLSLTKPYSSFGSGSITSASMFSHPNGFTDEYVVKGGAIWTRTTQFNNKWSDWENVTSNITVGSGTITSFVNTMHPNNYQLQYLTRGGEIWSRSNQFGWNNPGWLPATSNVSSVGSGVIKSFSQFTHSTGHIEQYLTRGELIWYRDNKNGWSSWANVTSNTNSVGGTGTINSFTSGLIKE
jgi:hypothetical protein